MLELPDRPDHTEQTQKQQKQQRGLGQQKGARASRAPPFVVSVNPVVSVVDVSVVCDQVDQVVPAHQVDDIDEVHELDPVHQVDHKDEFHFFILHLYNYKTRVSFFHFTYTCTAKRRSTS